MGKTLSDIVFECDGNKVHIFTSEDTYEVSHWMMRLSAR